MIHKFNLNLKCSPLLTVKPCGSLKWWQEQETWRSRTPTSCTSSAKETQLNVTNEDTPLTASLRVLISNENDVKYLCK